MVELSKRLSKGRLKNRQGFTLVELAIVLVIIGLIIAMAFKGKQLIDGAKVKNLAAQYNKIVAAINTFYERYGFYPGDGCNSTATPSSVSDCQGYRNGILDIDKEQEAFWHLLIDVTGILTKADRKSVFGQEWQVIYTNINNHTANWLDLDGEKQADARIACALDKLIDDGNSTTGIVRITDTDISWDETTDCWSLEGQCNVHIKILP